MTTGIMEKFMNERLREIAIKAQVEHCISHVRLEEFAELIVRECKEIALGYDGAKLGGPGSIIAMRIESHFDVAE